MKDGDRFIQEVEGQGGIEIYLEKIRKWRRYTYWLAYLKDKAEGF